MNDYVDKNCAHSSNLMQREHPKFKHENNVIVNNKQRLLFLYLSFVKNYIQTIIAYCVRNLSTLKFQMN